MVVPFFKIVFEESFLIKKLFVFVFAIAAALIFADDILLVQDLSKILNKENAEELVKNGSVLKYKYKNKNMDAVLVPDIKILTRMENDIYRGDYTPRFLIEALYIYKKETDKKIDVSKILRSISKLKGIQYYSHTNKQMQTLYVEADVVEKVEEDGKTVYKKVEDPLEGNADGLNILTRQQDMTFGNYIYRYKYFQDEYDVGFICTNTETILYSVFKVLSPYDMKIMFTAHDMGNYVLVYCSTAARFPRVPGLEKKLKNAFTSRLNALYGWFKEQYKLSEAEN